MAKTIVPIGPYHPLQEEPEFFTLTVEGERVVDIDVRVGYNHRGIEKLSASVLVFRPEADTEGSEQSISGSLPDRSNNSHEVFAPYAAWSPGLLLWLAVTLVR